MNDRFLTALFCDDVRHEVGNKLTLVGCYSGQMQITAIPATLPKLCVHITASAPRDNPFKQLTLLVCQGDHELARLEIPQNELVKATGRVPGEEERVGIVSVFAFSPVQVEKPCVFTVQAMTEEGLLKGSHLQIVQQLKPRKPKQPAVAVRR